MLSGSDTSGNALFGNLQVVAARQLNLNPVLFAATNSSGGVMGKMISPQNIATGVSVTKLKGQRGQGVRPHLRAQHRADPVARRAGRHPAVRHSLGHSDGGRLTRGPGPVVSFDLRRSRKNEKEGAAGATLPADRQKFPGTKLERRGEIMPEVDYAALARTLEGVAPKARIATDRLRTLSYGTDASFYRLIPGLSSRLKANPK